MRLRDVTFVTHGFEAMAIKNRRSDGYVSFIRGLFWLRWTVMGKR
jgi:hypothetical protein